MNCTSSPAGLDAARFVGDPVDTLTGAVFDHMLDFRLTAPLELRWHRHYDSSQSHRRLALGWGHTHDFDRYLRFDVDGISYYGPMGQRIGFEALMADGMGCSRNGMTLRRLSLRRYRLEQHAQPTMEFEFRHPAQRARLAGLFEGDHRIVFTCDDSNRLSQITDSTGRRLAVVESDDGRLESVSLEATPRAPPRLLIAYEYDAHGNLVKTSNESGAGYSFAYDDAGRLVRRTGRRGFEFRFVYDDQGRCLRAEGDDRLHGVTLEYVVDRRVTRVTRADGGVWTYFFDEAGALTQILDPLGGASRYVRDGGGRLVAELDSNGNESRVLYDPVGTPVARVGPLGRRITLPEDPNAGDPRIHRVAGNALQYEFGRLIDVRTIALPTLAESNSIAVPASARRNILTRAEARVTPMAESGILPAFEVRPQGIDWWPDPKRGRLFDTAGQLLSQVDDLGRERSWAYDASGNLAKYLDFDGGTWTYDNGRWHFLLGLTDPVGSTVTFTYTTQGEVRSFTDAAGARTEYVRDAKDQVVEVWRHGVLREAYTRDAAGNLLAKHDGEGRELLRFEIGPGNLPVKRVLASGEEHLFDHDESGRILLASTGTDRVEFAYDAFGNRTADKRNGKGVALRFERSYRLEEQVLFERFAVYHDHRADNALVITDPGGKTHLFRLLPHGMVERRLANGSAEFAQYDGSGRCVSKHSARASGAVRRRRFHWSGEGELRLVEDGAQGQVRYEYDAAHRLTRRIGGGRDEAFLSDRAGNLVRQPGLSDVVMDSGNRILSANGMAFVHDHRNHVRARDTVGGRVEYEYDSRDQLVAVRGAGLEWSAAYDALGRRTRKSWSGQTREYHWSTDQLVAETGSDGRLRLYLYTDPFALTPFLFLDYESMDAPCDSCKRYFVFSDQIGTPVSIEDDRGQEVWHATIEPFGHAHLSKHCSIEFDLRFPGHVLDPELGLHYNRFRYYDPLLGRYVQSDPWGLAGGDNLYAYRANPLGAVDVRGLGNGNKKKPDGSPEGCCDNESEPDTVRTGPKGDEPSEPKYGDRATDMSDGSRERDERYGVKILTGDDREAHRVGADSEGRLVFAQSGEVVDTADHPAIYVMDTDGNVYVHKDPEFGVVHHSTIAGGEPVASAGEIQVVNGQVTDIDDRSGHYGGNLQPNSPEVAKQELGQQGVDVSKTTASNFQG